MTAVAADRGLLSVEKLLYPSTIEWFEELGARYGWTTGGVQAALEKDETLRQAASLSNTKSRANSWFGMLSAAWHITGRPTYLPSLPLLQALLATDLTQAPAEACFAPHPVFLIELPEGADLTVRSQRDELPTSGYLVISDRQLFLAALTALLSGAFEDGENAANYMGVEPPDAPPKFGILPIAWGGSLENTTFGWYTVDLTSPDLDESVRESCRVTRALTGWDSAPEARKHLEAVLKVLLYLNSQGAQVDELPFRPQRTGGTSAKAREIHARLKRRWGSRIVLGGGLTVNPAAPVASDTSDDARRAGTRLHQVRGHFKRQAHGPALASRKTIWVAPYWRGLDEFGRTIHRKFILAPKEDPA